MLPNDFPYRFFNPLVSKHREDYIHVLLLIESALEESKRIALPRNALTRELRRMLQRENYNLDVSDEEGYDEEASGDPIQDNLAFTMRLLLRSGWVDTDESGDYVTESIFLTQYGKKLAVFLRDLSNAEDQSGHVVNIYSNLQQIRSMPENGLICIQNAYESTRRLLNNLNIVFAKIKSYYAAVLANTKPEELLSGHFTGYIRDVVDKLIFPIKVDDSVDRFKGPILNVLYDIQSDSLLLEQVISGALQTKRVSTREAGMDQTLRKLAYMKSIFDDIESYISQLDDKNQTYIRITRQKLTYMLSMDTSIKGDIIAILRDAKLRGEDDKMVLNLNQCFQLFDVKQITESSFYHPRKKHVRKRDDEVSIEPPVEAGRDEVDAIINTRAAGYTPAKINSYADRLLDGRASASSQEIELCGDGDYLMAIFLALNSTSHSSTYSFIPEDETVTRGRYSIPKFSIQKKDGYEK